MPEHILGLVLCWAAVQRVSDERQNAVTSHMNRVTGHQEKTNEIVRQAHLKVAV